MINDPQTCPICGGHMECIRQSTDTWECDTCDYTVGDADGHYCYTDLIGGVHSDGLGWNPNGVFCGECTYSTCENCKHRETKDYMSFKCEEIYGRRTLTNSTTEYFGVYTGKHLLKE